MKTYQVQELVEIAKRKSPFYRKLYKDIKVSDLYLPDLPIVNEDQFWKANSYNNNQIITESAMHGILLRSGGTTGKPKLSVFSSVEWRTFCQVMSSKLHEAKLLRTDDCIANMFACGSLYGSFLFVSDMLHESSTRILQLPISVGGEMDTENAVQLIKELKANVIMGFPLGLIGITHFIKSNNIKGIDITQFLYGGDVLLEAQYRYLKSVFPNATISSSGYASSDGGFLGYADSTCQLNEYRTDNHFTVMEIVDEKGQVIEDENIKGRLIITNLTKVLMPVIRYPVGDLAMWREPKQSKFRKLLLAGRHTKKDNLIILGSKKLDYLDFYKILNKSKFCENILGFQILANKKVVIQIASHVKEKNILKAAKNEIKCLVIDSIPGLDARLVEVEFIDFSELKYVSRTYKAIKIIKE